MILNESDEKAITVTHTMFEKGKRYKSREVTEREIERWQLGRALTWKLQ